MDLFPEYLGKQKQTKQTEELLLCVNTPIDKRCRDNYCVQRSRCWDTDWPLSHSACTSPLPIRSRILHLGIASPPWFLLRRGLIVLRLNTPSWLSEWGVRLTSIMLMFPEKILESSRHCDPHISGSVRKLWMSSVGRESHWKILSREMIQRVVF